MKPYDPETESLMLDFYHHLSEKDRRLYAAIEAKKLPHGGKSYISSLFSCSRSTLDSGLDDLTSLSSLPQDRLRREGGGSKRKIDTIPHLQDHFLSIVQDHLAGDPQSGKLWTNLSQNEITSLLRESHINVSRRVVKQLLQKNKMGQRKMSKTLRCGDFDQRNAQFNKIAQLRQRYNKSEDPILSIDGKKKNISANSIGKDESIHKKK